MRLYGNTVTTVVLVLVRKCSCMCVIYRVYRPYLRAPKPAKEVYLHFQLYGFTGLYKACIEFGFFKQHKAVMPA